MNNLLFIILALLCLRCGPIDPDPAVDDEGKVIPIPRAFDDYLDVVRTTPDAGPVGVRPTIRLEFSDYLDNDSWIDQTAVSLFSGGMKRSGTITSLFSQKALLFEPRSDLVAGLKYELLIDRSQFYSLNEAPLSEQNENLAFMVDEQLTDEIFELPDPYWDDVKAIFVAKCDTCHSDPNWGQIRLEYDSIIGRRSEQVDRFLVRAFDSSDSYLLHKILDDFDERKFTVQPPPWSDGVPLTEDEILIIDRWIQLGARRTEP